MAGHWFEDRRGATAARAFGGVAVALAILACPPAALAQPGPMHEETLTVYPSERHAPGGGLQSFLLGTTYRNVWSTPIEVPVLGIDSFAGGLEPLRRGGGQQTRVLHMRGADGRRYVFRSVDKRPVLGDTEPLRNTLVGSFIHTLPAHLHPGAAPVVASLLEEVGILHVKPLYVVMPDDPALAEYREEFGGMLGMLEERPNELEGDEPGFAGFTKIIATETLRDRLEESPRHRPAAREFLKARIVDLLVGDWDRHADQWRWARVEEEDGRTIWRPIPRDRDHAFVDHDGALISAGRRVFFPKAVPFRSEIGPIFGLSVNARDLDRELLAELPREIYDSMAVEVEERLTDETLEEAVRSMPRPLYEEQGDELLGMLRSRRASLREAVHAWYDQISELIVIRATDEAERAEVERRPDALVVRLSSEGAESPYFQRVIPSEETGEVRIFLRGGDDRALVRGAAERSPLVRIIGGGGDDVLVDSSRVASAGPRTTLHDDRGTNELIAGPSTRLDPHPYRAPERELTGFADVLPPDYGSELRFRPWLDYRGSVGLIVGGGAVRTGYGFRQDPYASRVGVRALYATGEGGLALEANGDFPRRHGPSTAFTARASQIERFRFFGWGNDSAAGEPTSTYEVDRDELLLVGAAYGEVGNGALWSAGPVLKYGVSEGREGSPFDELAPYGDGELGQIGMHAGLSLDRRDDLLRPRSGFLLVSGGEAYPPIWDMRAPFARGELEGRGYLGLPLPLAPTLALRAGGTKVWGDFPVHEAAFLGGSESVRGYPFQRYAGDGSIYGNLEVRTPLSRANLLLLAPDVGLIFLSDAGRIFTGGESAGGWHTSVGAGLWFEFTVKNQLYALSTTFARGSTDRFYLKMGLPF